MHCAPFQSGEAQTKAEYAKPQEFLLKFCFQEADLKVAATGGNSKSGRGPYRIGAGKPRPYVVMDSDEALHDDAPSRRGPFTLPELRLLR